MAKTSNDTQDELRESAHRIWLAGLGALAMAGEEGKALFKSLVEKGEEFEAKGKVRVDKVRGKVKDARSNLGMVMDRLQGGVDDQVTAALHRIGVPTRNEIATLTKKVEELTRTLERMKEAPAPKAKKAEVEPAVAAK